MEKLIESKILIKTGNISDWLTINPILALREIAAVTVPVDDGTTTTLIKIGDGINNFLNLPFISALSADVEDYAKQSEEDFITWITTIIDGLNFSKEGHTHIIDNIDNLYIQEEEPLDASIGSIWIDTSEIGMMNAEEVSF